MRVAVIGTGIVGHAPAGTSAGTVRLLPSLTVCVPDPPRVELRPDGPGQLLLHSRELDGLLRQDGITRDDLATRLRELASAACPELETSTIAGARVSQRPIPGDGFPSVGAAETIGGYYEAVTHSGITLGPILGRLLAQEILNGRVDDLVANYRPARFG
jgi:glycine/D-amino acid oxidase-like deaminating enzyme